MDPNSPALIAEPATIPQKQQTDVTISASEAILHGATVTARDQEVVIGSPSVNKSDANHVTVSVAVPSQGDFVLLVHPGNSVGLGDFEIKVTGQ